MPAALLARTSRNSRETPHPGYRTNIARCLVSTKTSVRSDTSRVSPPRLTTTWCGGVASLMVTARVLQHTSLYFLRDLRISCVDGRDFHWPKLPCASSYINMYGRLCKHVCVSIAILKTGFPLAKVALRFELHQHDIAWKAT